MNYITNELNTVTKKERTHDIVTCIYIYIYIYKERTNELTKQRKNELHNIQKYI